MGYITILAKLLGMFPAYQEQVRSWQPNGNNSIIVELKDFTTKTFTYYNDKEWELVSTNPAIRGV